MYDPNQVPIAAPIPATQGPPNKAKSAGNITPHLNCPTPQGVGMRDVVAIEAVYSAAQIAIIDTVKDLLLKVVTEVFS